ncbi:type 1 glutamine amidotransferase [Yinghuangia seranimata]|uniref:type 1 glutamine amidotransferase n=1 Tax=Yinghuangia seranimata TaxID=408067 RepID=UPI00248CA569|nr:type 1 glutamine amidotransferase [Yinghuangia seranimata]MDI2125306.1 type 1 glutamine amidotransferase [Yinghuangia seranimata]
MSTTHDTPTVLTVEHEDGTGPGLFGARVEAAGVRLDVRRPWAGDPLPDDLDGYAGLLVLGGSPGPYDDGTARWLPHTRALLRAAVAADLPTFGICLGAELLAVACGGSVRHAPLPEVGLVPVTPLHQASADPLFAPLADSAAAPAVQWHWEEVDALPDEAVPLMTSPRCAYQAFRMGSAVWAVQFHPEVLADAARDWAGHDAGRLPELGIDPDRMIAEIAAAEPQLRAAWGALADRWAAVVANHRAPNHSVPSHR